MSLQQIPKKVVRTKAIRKVIDSNKKEVIRTKVSATPNEFDKKNEPV